jgi:diguanylate cyclase (GGDEF)-like protein
MAGVAQRRSGASMWRALAVHFRAPAPRWRVLLPLLAGLTYYLGALLGVAASAMSEGISIFWLPNGVLLAALLVTSRREWPGYLLAAVLAEIAADLPAFTLTQALGFAAVNVFECLLAAYLLERIARPFKLDSLRRVVQFGAYVLIVVCGLAALLGAAIYALSGPTPTSFWASWRIWWLGDGLGVLLITPLILGWLQRASPPDRRQRLEAAALLTLTLLLAAWVFSPAADMLETAFPRRAFLLLPLALWAAVRFGIRGAASVDLLIAGIAITATLYGRGPLVVATPEATVLLVQEYLAVLILSSLALAALLQELRDRNATLQSREAELHATHDALDRLNRELEARVHTRTHELEEANRCLEELASTDTLTGASNRRYFLDEARKEISRAKRQGTPLSMIMIDVDLFKGINDRHGHEIGDLVLSTLATTVRAALREGDMFARLGGEEFIVMLPGQGVEEAMPMAERQRALVAAIRHPELPEGITISLGVTGLESEEDRIEDLLRRADLALYEAKHLGRNRVCRSAVTPPGAGAN